MMSKIKPTTTSNSFAYYLRIATFILIIFYFSSSLWSSKSIQNNSSEGGEFTCPLPDSWSGSSNETLNSRFENYFISREFTSNALKRFSSAIQVETVSFDEMRGNPKSVPYNMTDKYHEPFLDFHQVLLDSYPSLHAKLTKVIINKFSLLYIWKGSNSTLKPAMLMAHQDVVPIDPMTLNDWKYPPFSGHYSQEEKRIYGRGTSDTKLSLVSILEAVEALVEMDFNPQRTWIISFGHDEEISGFNGISRIVEYMQKELGIPNKGIEFVVDEGSNLERVQSPSNRIKNDSPLVALVAIAEKDLNITIKMKKGGHASLPPPHTGIGLLSQIITTIESNPSSLLVQEDNPVIKQMKCMAQHTSTLSSYQKFAISHFSISLPFIYRWFSGVPFLKASISTTQSADIISGGVKVNAIPTSAFGVFNLRINPHENVNKTVERIKTLVFPIAEKQDLDLDVSVGISPDRVEYHETLIKRNTSVGGVVLDFAALEPSPVSWTNTTSYSTLSSVIRHVFGSETIVSPTLMVANTDTKFVWQLTDNIYRFVAAESHGDENVHTVNEFARLDGLVSCTRFYHELIRAFD